MKAPKKLPAALLLLALLFPLARPALAQPAPWDPRNGALQVSPSSSDVFVVYPPTVGTHALKMTRAMLYTDIFASLSCAAPLVCSGGAFSLTAATTSEQGSVLLATPSSDTTAGHVVQASDTRLSDSRTPTGTASGDLSSTFPSPTVIKLHLAQATVVFSQSPYTLLASDSTISCNATSGAIVLNLPAATGSGRVFRIKKTDSSSNACTLTRAGSDTIDGATTVALTAQYASSTIEDSGSGTWIRTHVNQLAGDVTGASTASTVTKINGVSLSGLATGLLKNTTGTGAPSIAVAADIPTLAHSSLSGLSSDDHTIYALLAGRSGGQSFTGGTAANDQLVVRATSNSTYGPIILTANAASPVSPPSQTVLQVAGKDTNNAVLTVDAYGAGAHLIMRRTDGTAASPTGIQSGEVAGSTRFHARDSSGAYGLGSLFNFAACSTWSSTDHCAQIDVQVVPSGSTTATASFHFLDSGHIQSAGTAPTVACTGTGTSPTAPSLDTGSTDTAFTIVMPTGTGSPASSGTCTVTFAKAYGPTNNPVLVCTLQAGASGWGVGSGIVVSTKSLSAPVLTWWNESAGVLTGLATSTSYQISCIATSK